MCCARAIVVGLAIINNDPETKKIRDVRCLLQKNRALELHQQTEIPPGPCGIPEVKKFEDYLGIQIHIVSSENFNKVNNNESVLMLNMFFFLLNLMYFYYASRLSTKVLKTLENCFFIIIKTITTLSPI